MRILLAYPERKLSQKQGVGRHLSLLANELRLLGHTCDILSVSDVLPNETPADAILRMLNTDQAKYDVLDFEYNTVDLDFSKVPQGILTVARSFLLVHHRINNPIPHFGMSEKKHFKWYIRRLLNVGKRDQLQIRIDAINAVISESDCIHVLNSYDSDKLLKTGLAPNKLFQLPCALDSAVREQLRRCQSTNPGRPVLLFSGTFDTRKGAVELPKIFSQLAAKYSDLRFRMIGCQGAFTSEKQVLAHFPEAIRDRIELHMVFDNSMLSKLLSDVTCGVFPSYWEGSPLAVLEQLAAGIPVAAYDAPGSADLLPDEWLAERGKWQSLTGILDKWLEGEISETMRDEARRRGSQFTWSDIAKKTADHYERLLAAKRECV